VNVTFWRHHIVWRASFDFLEVIRICQVCFLMDGMSHSDPGEEHLCFEYREDLRAVINFECVFLGVLWVRKSIGNITGFI
jgi:hypothetical protein